jgi:hypothetical protein
MIGRLPRDVAVTFLNIDVCWRLMDSGG